MKRSLPLGLWRFAQERAQWLRQASAPIACALVLFAALIWIWRIPTENCVEIVTVTLNIGGTAIVLWGLLGLRREFGLQPLRHMALVWWRGRPRWGRGALFETSAFTRVQSDVSLSWDIQRASATTVEARLRALEEQIEQLPRLQQAMQQLQSTVTTNRNQQSDALEHAKITWQSQLRTLHTGSFAETVCGLIWALSATALSAKPASIIALAQSLR